MEETELQSDDLLHILGSTMANVETTWVEYKGRSKQCGAKEGTSWVSWGFLIPSPPCAFSKGEEDRNKEKHQNV